MSSKKTRKEQILTASHMATWWKGWQALNNILQTGDVLTCCHDNIATEIPPFKWFRNNRPTHLPMGYERCYHTTSWAPLLPQS